MFNESLVHFENDYIFTKIAQKAKNSHKPLLHLGIGDVSYPLAPAIVKAIQTAAQEMQQRNPGYGPSSGYDFLKEKIIELYHKNFALQIDEIFISDGAKTISSQITHLFNKEVTYGLCNPVYPVYLASNQIMGKHKFICIPLTKENHFTPTPPKEKCDLIYLCSPNNPTGIAWDHQTLKQFVDYALQNNCLLVFDGAYRDFIQSQNKVKSIFEIEGAKKVAIEICSFSKSAGFTSLLVGYMAISKECRIQGQSIHALWKKRLPITTNGVSYIMQKAALAALENEGRKQTMQQIQTVMLRAKKLKEALLQLEYCVYGGKDCPYIWWKIPRKFTSWQFFDYLLENFSIVSTPGVGFGTFGEGYVRLSAFGSQEHIEKAIEQLKNIHASIH